MFLGYYWFVSPPVENAMQPAQKITRILIHLRNN
jgi:hypothetical protein